MDENVDMFRGVWVSIEDLDKSLMFYSKVDKRRQWRAQDWRVEIARKLWSMSMACDEYIVWLSLNDYFPSNYSIRGLMGPMRYDLIKEGVQYAIADAPSDRVDPPRPQESTRAVPPSD